MHPLIGLPTATYVSTTNGLTYYRSYARIVQAIVHAGGLPILIPVDLPDDEIREMYQRVSGILIPGGGDLDPMIYGAERHPATQEADDARDHTELVLARWAVEDDKALLGICRGHQVINVALGGTLVQDIPSELHSDIRHDTKNDPDGRVARVHDVRIQPSSRLAQILGGTLYTVNSLHHQSVDAPAPGTVITALAPDEVVEALEIPDKRFAISVQWHPEDLYLNDAAMRRLFEAFVAAAR